MGSVSSTACPGLETPRPPRHMIVATSEKRAHTTSGSPGPGATRAGSIRVSAGDEPVVLQHPPYLLHGGVGRREDELGGDQGIGRQRLAVLPGLFQQVVQRLAEGGFVPRLQRLFQRVVEGVEQVEVGLGQIQLTLTHDANDHEPSFWPLPPSICGVLSPPPPSSNFMRSSSASTPVVLAIRSSSDWMSSLELSVTSSSAPEASNSSTAPARACISAVLSSALCTAMPTSPISSEIPEKASLICVWAWAAV